MIYLELAHYVTASLETLVRDDKLMECSCVEYGSRSPCGNSNF